MEKTIMTTPNQPKVSTKGLKVMLKARTYHGILYKVMARLGKTQAKMAEYLGINTDTFGQMLRLKHVPNLTTERGKKLKQKLEELTEMTPPELFPNHIFAAEFLGRDKTVEVTREVPSHLLENASAIYQLSLPPDETLMQEEEGASRQEEILDKVLSSIQERQRLVLRMRFIEGKTLDECAHAFKISRESTRRIEAVALHLMRHPSRICYLADWAHWGHTP